MALAPRRRVRIPGITTVNVNVAVDAEATPVPAVLADFDQAQFNLLIAIMGVTQDPPLTAPCLRRLKAISGLAAIDVETGLLAERNERLKLALVGPARDLLLQKRAAAQQNGCGPTSAAISS